MAEIAVAIAAKVAEYLVHPLIHPFTYCCNYKSNLEKLKNEVQKLRDAKESVQHKVDDAKRSGEDIEQRVENWLITAEQILDAAARIIERTEDTTNRLCPNLNTRYQVSKKAAREVKAAAELLQQEGRFDKVSYRTVPEDIWLTSIKGYEAFESRMSTLNDVINALKNPDVHMIGVYGIGGVGKTMLVKEVARQARNDKLFDEVVYADVSQTPDIKKIQGQIADKLGLKFYEESESGRARKLCERLRKEKKILVILDNIWTNLDLENVGIPFGDRGCGVLMTARSQDVLSSKMDCQNNFLVGALNESEAWDLFKKLVGDKIENNDLKAVAVDIAKACGGLPIAIVTIARALRNKNTFEWKNALRELTRPSSSSFSGVPAEAYKSIELSYNHLEGEELKSTFLLCCLMDFIENPSVLYLLSYGMGLGLFKGTHTMEEARDRALTLVDKLKNSCLLLDGPESEYFSVHDVVRDVAISIASRDQHSIAVNNIEAPPRELLDRDTLKNCTAISLHNCKIGELVDGLECPRLKFFHISPREGFIKIPDNFFTRLTELRVLDFTEMHLLSLPSSLHLLVNLQTLCLDNGVLGDVAVIGELKQLEILSFQGSNIEQLPREIGQLTRLRSLNLSSCYQLKAISSNVISNLSQLEELYLGDTFIQWETEGQSSSERSRASLHELKHLSSLNTLEIQVRDPKVLPKGLLSQKLKRYKVFIGDEWNWPDRYENQRILKLKLNASICLKDEFFMQLKGLEELWLDEVQGVENVVYELDREGFPSLKHLHIQNNPYLLCINDSTELVPLDAFPLLESLSLSNLMNLEKISCSQLRAESFIRLRNLKVESCEKLTHIFSFSISRGLPQLQTIEVIACKSMKQIFVVGREDDINNTEVVDKIEFSQLRKLTLKSLPQLRSFCSVVKNSLQRQQELLASGTLSTEVILDHEPDTNKQFFNEKVCCQQPCSVSLYPFCFFWFVKN
ncbi:putative disease resistance protein [Citrus sinensis]|uniref:Disease resistance protein n=1 Tax=Citrus sinensis TaxID=2711 RepID=A0ACB8KK99_CITSI|nr:putative disease resistance protein [Citrus sinensis]